MKDSEINHSFKLCTELSVIYLSTLKCVERRKSFILIKILILPHLSLCCPKGAASLLPPPCILEACFYLPNYIIACTVLMYVPPYYNHKTGQISIKFGTGGESQNFLSWLFHSNLSS